MTGAELHFSNVRFATKAKIFFVFVLFFSSGLDAYEYEHARAVAFDRGLTSIYEPFAPSGNPALLTLKDRFRFHVESITSDVNSYRLSLVYPVSPFTGFGFSYFSKDRDTMNDVPQGLFRVIQKEQAFSFSLGYSSWLKWGQHFELNYTLNRFSTLSGSTQQSAPFENDQNIKCSYRLGVYKELGKGFSIGLLTTPIFQLAHQVFEDSKKSSESRLVFFENKKPPMAAVQWNPMSWLSLALSNRSQYGRDDVQCAAEFSTKYFMLSGAVHNRGAHKNPGYIIGLGCYISGVNIFTAFNVIEDDMQIAASFAPEKNVELVQVVKYEVGDRMFYPYHLKYGISSRLLDVCLQRNTEKPVEVVVKLSGRGLPTIHDNFSLNQPFRSVAIDAPSDLEHMAAGKYCYTLEITAYQRSRQTIRQSISFEMHDKHHWSGNADDLVYFLTPDNDQLLAEAKKIALPIVQGQPQRTTIEIIKKFYDYIRDNIHYMNDPRLVHKSQDWVQYPVETLNSRMGDCEDLTVLFASMLQSIGIKTAFVEYVPPGADHGHVFVLIESGKSVNDLLAENQNLQNYVIRQDNNESRCYVPLELTRADLSFIQSWKYAIAIYYKYAVEQKGLADGWFHIIDVH